MNISYCLSLHFKSPKHQFRVRLSYSEQIEHHVVSHSGSSRQKGCSSEPTCFSSCTFDWNIHTELILLFNNTATTTRILIRARCIHKKLWKLGDKLHVTKQAASRTARNLDALESLFEDFCHCLDNYRSTDAA